MQNDTQIQGSEGIFLPLLQPKTILQKMRIGAGRVALDPGHTVHQLVAIQRPGSRLADHIGMF